MDNKKIVEMAKAYLLSFEEIDNIIIQKHLNNWQNRKPVSMDKLFWLVGSGKFYLDKIKIKTDRDEFIKMVRNEI